MINPGIDLAKAEVVFAGDNYELALKRERDTGWDMVHVLEDATGVTIVTSEHHPTIFDGPANPTQSRIAQIEATTRVNDWHVADTFGESVFGRKMLNLFGIDVRQE